VEQYFENYASLEQQRWMVSDEPRTTAFAKAIAEVVKPGDVVIDVGAGTGLLSILAAKAGARRVVAVERSAMAEHARALIAHNGVQDIVEVFEGNGDDLVLGEKADVIVSEWLGHMAYVENMFDVVRNVRDAHLKPDGIMIPSSVKLHLAAVDAAEGFHEHGAGYWEKAAVHGIDFSCFTQRELDQGLPKRLTFPADLMLGPGTCFHRLQTRPAIAGEEWRRSNIEVEIERDGTLNGFVGWFSALLSPSVVLNTSPRHPTTHWEHNLFPFLPTKVKAGDKVKVAVRFDGLEEFRMIELTLEVNGESISYVLD
jgi:type I protein arginine methyltransferase